MQQYALRPYRKSVDGDSGRRQKGYVDGGDDQGEGCLRGFPGRQGQENRPGLPAARGRRRKGHPYSLLGRKPAVDADRVCDGLAERGGSSAGMRAEYGTVQSCGVLQPCDGRRGGYAHPGQGPQHAESLDRVVKHAADVRLVGRFAVQQGGQRLPINGTAGGKGFLTQVVAVALFAALLVAVIVNAVTDQDDVAVAALVHHQQVAGAEQHRDLAADPTALLRRFGMGGMPAEYAGLEHLRHVPGEVSVQYPAKGGVVHGVDEGGAVQKQHMLLRSRFRRGQLVSAGRDLHHPIHAALVVLNGIAPRKKCFRCGQQGGNR